VVTTFVNPHHLVETDLLAEHLDDPGVRILDVTAKLTSSLHNRARAECYDAGHIPGSVFFDVASGWGVLSDPDHRLPWMWPSPQRLEAVLAEAGVSGDTRVVLVARTPREGIDSGTMWCTRAWWTLHHAGVDVAVLWGGIEQWEAEGRPLTTDEPDITPGAFRVRTGWEGARATADDVQAALVAPGACVIDALPAANFAGEEPGYGPRRGHITGAANLPFRSLIEGETARFLPPAAMARILGDAGLLEAGHVVTYCGGAIAATVDAFALALFGHRSVAVYDGSLMEWSSDPDRPMTDPSAR
jgi:thiosulfate/3-mercaptopyruvate sulfurtransferase